MCKHIHTLSHTKKVCLQCSQSMGLQFTYRREDSSEQPSLGPYHTAGRPGWTSVLTGSPGIHPGP